MDPVVGRIVLVIYAALVGAGGVMGFVRAKSRPSLIAGLASAALALGALGVTFADPKMGFGLGAGLAAALLAMFAIRYSKGAQVHARRPDGARQRRGPRPPGRANLHDAASDSLIPGKRRGTPERSPG